MDRNKYHIFILIDQFHDLLCRISVRNTYQTGKTSHTMIGMYHIITGGELIQLFQRKGDLSRTGFITLQVIFMETVEQLVIGETGFSLRLWSGLCMKGLQTIPWNFVCLPKPTSPHTRRSIGISRSISCFTSAVALLWSWCGTFFRSGTYS